MDPRFRNGRGISSSAAVTAAVAVQLCATLMLHYGYLTEQTIPVTKLGRSLCRPEREIPLFVLACAGAVLAGIVAAWGLARLSKWRAFTHEEQASLSRTLTFLSIGSFVLYIPLAYDQLIQLSSASPHTAYDLVPFLLPACLLLAIVAVELLVGPTARSRGSAVTFGLFPFLFVALLFPKDWHALSGEYFNGDDMLHHMNFFVVTPFVNMVHGKVLAGEAYSQYGLGWPTLFRYIIPLGTATYAVFLLAFMLFTIAYLGSFSALLRFVTGSYTLAAAGVLAWFGLVSMKTGHLPWMMPQALPPRFPFDALIITGVYASLRTGRRHYGLAVSVLLAMALFSITDTGLFMLVAVGSVALLRTVSRVRSKAFRWKESARETASCVVVFSLSLLVMVLVAVEEAAFTPAFWSGWLKGLVDSGHRLGYGSIPFMHTDLAGLTLFCLLMFLYLPPIVRGTARALQGRLKAREAFLALVGIYGLELMVSFVSTSRAGDRLQKFMHPAILLVLVYWAWGWRMKRVGIAPSRRRIVDAGTLGVPLLLAVCAALGLSKDKGVLPLEKGLWSAQHIYRGPDTYFPPAKIELRTVTAAQRERTEELTPLFELGHQCRKKGQSMAVLSSLDGSLYLATGARPCLDGPYVHSILTVGNRAEALEQLLEETPPVIILQAGPVPQLIGVYYAAIEDSSRFFRENLADVYRLKRRIGPFDVLELRSN